MFFEDEPCTVFDDLGQVALHEALFPFVGGCLRCRRDNAGSSVVQANSGDLGARTGITVPTREHESVAVLPFSVTLTRVLRRLLRGFGFRLRLGVNNSHGRFDGRLGSPPGRAAAFDIWDVIL